MEEVLLFGVSELSERIDYYISHGESVKPMQVKGFIIDDDYYTEDSFAGKKIYKYSQAKENFSNSLPVIICIGYKNMNENRQKIFQRLQADGWTIESFISSQTIIHTENIGVGNIFLCRSLIEVKSSMGDCNIFDSGHLGHHSVAGSFNFFAYNITGGNIKVGNFCFIGLNSTIKNGITLQDKTLVGAGCYLNQDTPKPGLCYAPQKPVLLGNSNLAMSRWTSK